MTTIDLVSEFTHAMRENLSQVAYGDGQLLTVPFTFSDGEAIQLLVREHGHGLYSISDRGQVADSLVLAGVNLEAKGVQASWKEITHNIEFPALESSSIYEIGIMIGHENLGEGISELISAILSAEGLRVAAKTKGRRTFKERVVQNTMNHGLAVRPRDSLPTVFGHRRQVTLSMMAGPRKYWVQTISGQGLEDFDRTVSIFGHAAADRGSLITLIDRNKRVEKWQSEALEEVSQVVNEEDHNAFLTELVAA